MSDTRWKHHIATFMATVALSNPAQADNVLVVAVPAHNSLVSSDGSIVDVEPATVNPARQNGGGTRPSRNHDGPRRIRITSPDERSVHHTAPVMLEVRLGSGARLSGFQAFLYHRDVTSKFAPDGDRGCDHGPCTVVATVVPHDGLQRGRNMLRVKVPRLDPCMSFP